MAERSRRREGGVAGDPGVGHPAGFFADIEEAVEQSGAEFEVDQANEGVGVSHRVPEAIKVAEVAHARVSGGEFVVHAKIGRQAVEPGEQGREQRALGGGAALDADAVGQGGPGGLGVGARRRRRICTRRRRSGRPRGRRWRVPWRCSRRRGRRAGWVRRPRRSWRRRRDAGSRRRRNRSARNRPGRVGTGRRGGRTRRRKRSRAIMLRPG